MSPSALLGVFLSLTVIGLPIAFVLLGTGIAMTLMDPDILEVAYIQNIIVGTQSFPLIAIPLFIVTMTSQNIPGIAVLASFGYRPGMRGPLLYTGTASVVGAVGGGHDINLAAISAALAAGPEAHPDPDRRWIAGVSCGFTYLAFGPLSMVITAAASAAPPGLVETIAGLALLGTLAGSAATALRDVDHREAAALTLVVAASGMTVVGVGAAFWSLVAGAAYLLVTRGAARLRT